MKAVFNTQVKDVLSILEILADKNGFETKAIPMKNTHHAKLDELIISKNLSWAK